MVNTSSSWGLVPLQVWLSLYCPLNCHPQVPQELRKVHILQWEGKEDSNGKSKVQQRAERFSQYTTIEELVDRAIYEILHSGRGSNRPHHVLVLGYRKGKSGMYGTPITPGRNVHTHGIQRRHNNSIVSYLKMPYWGELHKQVGDEVMLRLLKKEIMVLKYDKKETSTSFYVQISGRVFFTHFFTFGKTKENKKGSIMKKKIDRSRIFYISRFGRQCGLPKNHILHCTNVRKAASVIFKVPLKKVKKSERVFAKHLLENSKRCPYGVLLERHCPQKGKFNDHVTDFLSLSTPHSQVGMFLKSVVIRILPRKISRDRTLLEKIQQFVSIGRYDSYSVGQLLQGTRIKVKLLLWIFDDLLVPLLRSHFYCTEGSRCGVKVYYFRKPLWARITAKGIKQMMQESIFEPMNDKNQLMLNSGDSCSTSKLRFVPKISGSLRPIMNLSFKPHGERFSTNQKLQNVFQALKFEVKEKPSLTGCGMAGIACIYPLFKQFVCKIKDLRKKAGMRDSIYNNADEDPLLFITTLDVKSCYDTILHAKLFDVLKDVLKRDEYCVHKHTLVSYKSIGEQKPQNCKRPLKQYYLNDCSNPKSVVKFIKQVEDDNKGESDFSFLNSAAKNPKKKNCIFTDGVESSKIKRSKVMLLLRNHIQKNLVHTRMGSTELCFLQKKGIPQGSVVSTILCNIYYGDLERRFIRPLLDKGAVDNKHYLLLRLVDDFMLISTSESDVHAFSRTFESGFPDYGCYVNPAKTQFSSSDDPWVSWCGFKFHAQRLWVRMDHSRILSLGKIALSFSADFTNKSVSEGFLKYLTSTVALKCDPILFDKWINSDKNCVYNLTQVFVFVALRFEVCCNQLQFLNHSLLTGILLRVVRYTFALIQHRTGNNLNIGYKGLESIASYTFLIVFKRYPKLKVLLQSNSNGIFTRTDNWRDIQEYKDTISKAILELLS